MQIGGFVKQSLIDYPGRIAAVIFTQGCNFRCGYCHNPALVLPELFHQNQCITKVEILEYLIKRKNWIEAVVVTGGEPTIHNDLPEFLKEIKDLGFPVKLDTNGSNPSMVKHLLKKNLIDSIAMDIKILPINNDYARIIGIDNVLEINKYIETSIILLKNADIEVEFRTTSIPKFHDQAILEGIKKYLGNKNPYIINEFREGETIDSFICTNNN